MLDKISENYSKILEELKAVGESIKVSDRLAHNLNARCLLFEVREELLLYTARNVKDMIWKTQMLKQNNGQIKSCEFSIEQEVKYLMRQAAMDKPN